MMNNTYKINIYDRNYINWDTSLSQERLNINPLDSKLFTNDVFSIDDHKQITIIYSHIRNGQSIPGVLVLEGNKTYGRQYAVNIGKKNAGGKLLYKCVPDDEHLPPFLVPYEIKKMGFSKVFENMYVTMCFDHWDDKHPRGKLTNVIGPVSNVVHFYEYQLHCKELHISIQKFQKDTLCSIEKSSHKSIINEMISRYPNIQDRTDQLKWQVMSIDPEHSLDFDDAFSILDIDREKNSMLVSIYISNVTLWLDILELWQSFSKRVSTIYMPDKKRPMLPNILSDDLCSLKENVKRVAFVLDIYIQEGKIERIEYNNAIINVSNNYVYEEDALLKNPRYKELFSIVQHISKKYKYINKVEDSHDVVCYLMILMNYYCAKEMLPHKCGIFRSNVIIKEVDVPEYLPENVSKYIKLWSSSSSRYVSGIDVIDVKHETLQLDAYIHITSPIRRLVDLLNMIQFQKINKMVVLSSDAEDFYNDWLSKIDYINIIMRNIRKVQTDCSLLHLCQHYPETMEKEYDCYIFDKCIKGEEMYEYNIFIPEINMSSRLKSREEYDIFSNKKCRLYLFYNEDKLKRKIRVQLYN